MSDLDIYYYEWDGYTNSGRWSGFRYIGELRRSIYSPSLDEYISKTVDRCPHNHKSSEAALKCARRMLQHYNKGI